MTFDEAHALARGYAWGYSDAAHTPVRATDGNHSGALQFAEEYAAKRTASEEFGTIQDAFALWQRDGRLPDQIKLPL